MISIFRTLDDLIQRTDDVKVCQEYLTLVAASLARLRHALNMVDTRKDDTRFYEGIVRTLQALDEVISSCNEKETDLRGTTYRDFESLLLRLRLRLAQHEADFTDDYETKIRVLRIAHHEQQIFTAKVFDEKIQQRLDIMEQLTKENTMDQLCLLREKYFQTIKTYLHYCTELHKIVPLGGLTGHTVAKVAQKYYQISAKTQIELKESWRSCERPLTRTFVQFKADKSTSFERNEARRIFIGPTSSLFEDLHSEREESVGIWQRLVSAPYMMLMVERDRYAEEMDVTEENIIKTKRWIVILGDPGSGKTSFARWLVCHLAQILLLNGQHSTDYGPLRIPILIRIGEFTDMLKEHPSLTLFDYAGKHKWMGKAIINHSSASLKDLSIALQDYIKQGQALIILDGLDEIPVSEQRSKIINAVENFVENYVQTPTGISAFDSPHLSKLFDNPSRTGGNQMVVTSRIVAYHAAPLAGQFAHYIIRPMDIEHMKDFVDYWFFRVHQQILNTLNLSVPNEGGNHSEALKKELEKKENVGLLDMASNSCLMSFICSVAFIEVKGSPLPTQRILLYEQIVNSMLNLWRQKGSAISIVHLTSILSDIATYIHQHSASGLIYEEK